VGFQQDTTPWKVLERIWSRPVKKFRKLPKRLQIN
jgi:hypothetical protein